MLADHALHPANDRPGSVMNDSNFHRGMILRTPINKKVCLAIRNQESDLNPERCVLVWLSFGTGKRQGSSVVEQGTHKPLVGSSTLPPGMPRHGCNPTDSALASGVWAYLPDTGCRSTNSFAQHRRRGVS